VTSWKWLILHDQKSDAVGCCCSVKAIVSAYLQHDINVSLSISGLQADVQTRKLHQNRPNCTVVGPWKWLILHDRKSMNSGTWECRHMPNFRCNEDLRKLDKEYVNASICKFVIYFLQHSETFDVSHVFLPQTIAVLSTLKQVRFFGPPCTCIKITHVYKTEYTHFCQLTEEQQSMIQCTLFTQRLYRMSDKMI